MSAGVVAPGLTQYLIAVRRELADLGGDEVDELTEGLEADLADALAGSGATPEGMFGPPGEYAAELRTAAGLPRSGSGREIRWRGTNFAHWRDRQAWWPEVRGFVDTCRPLWWAFRAFVLYQAIAQAMTDAYRWLPYGWSGWSLLLVLVVGSIELERRDLAPGSAVRRFGVGAVNLLAAGSVLVAGWALVTGSSSSGLLPVRLTALGSIIPPAHLEEPAPEGVLNDGHPVVNIFPYDAEGNLLEGVQLFDDQGRAIDPGEKSYLTDDLETVTLVPAQTADGQQRFNVYPLKETVLPDFGDEGELIPRNLRDARAPDRMQYPVTLPTPLPDHAGDVTAASTGTEEE